MRMLALLLIGLFAAAAARAEVPALKETPNLAAQVKRGELPPVEKRVPNAPLVTQPTEMGSPGGQLRLLMGGAKDTRLMVVYGYARLVRYTPAYELEPDLAESIDVEDGRRFIGHHVGVEVTSVLQTHAGKMIFGRVRSKAERKSS